MQDISAVTPVVPSASHEHPAASKARRSRDSDFQQCLKQYATAALGVAGVSVFAGAQAPPVPHIWYTVANIPLNTFTPSQIPIDFNHDGIPDLTISVTGHYANFSGHGGYAVGTVNAIPAVGNFAIGAHAIPQGKTIDRGGVFKAGKQQMARAYNFVVSGSYKTSSGGPFKNVTNEYLGVRFQISGQQHEGWIRVTLKCNFGDVSGTISGYAFDTVANEDGLVAGQIRGPVVPVKASVEKAVPGSLGMLAAGSSAVPYWRQEAQ